MWPFFHPVFLLRSEGAPKPWSPAKVTNAPKVYLRALGGVCFTGVIPIMSMSFVPLLTCGCRAGGPLFWLQTSSVRNWAQFERRTLSLTGPRPSLVSIGAATYDCIGRKYVPSNCRCIGLKFSRFDVIPATRFCASQRNDLTKILERSWIASRD